MMYQLPSCNAGETISIPPELRDSLSCLDIVWSDMFEAVEINPDRDRQQELDFLQGAPPTWLNFYTSVNLPLVERDGFNDLIQVIERQKEKICLISDVSLRYQPGSGGSTLGMQVLWHFRRDLRCARAIDSDIDTKELSKQVLDLFLLYNEEHAEQDQKTVLLLLDTKGKRDNDLPIKDELWGNLIKEIHNRGINTQTPVVILLDWNTEDLSLNDTLILASKPSEEKIKQLKEKLLQQIRLQRKSQWKVTTINLLCDEDSGGSALAREILQELSDKFTCGTWKDPLRTEITREIENMTDALIGKYKTHKKPVLLLLDHSDDEPLRYLLKKLQSKLQQDQTDGPAFVIINVVRKSLVRGRVFVKLKLELLPEEKERFAQKSLEIEKKHKEMSKTFHAFNIMRGGFQREDAEKVITGEMVNLIEKDKTSSSTKLLSFLALINSYVPGSHLSKSLCEKFTDGKPSVEEIMKPFMDLIVIFSDGKANCIRLKHQMIADACLKMVIKNNLTRFDITLDFLNKMVKGNESDYEQICKRLLFTRPQGLTGKEIFSRLILDIMREGTTIECIGLLERASRLFSTDPFYPQALSRLYYIKVTEKRKYREAEKWAKEAIERDPKKSHIRDTLGQVHKNHLSRIWTGSIWVNVNKPFTDTRLRVAESAIKAFEDEEKAAEDELDDDTKFNIWGHFGFLQVCKEIYDLISPKNPLEQQYHDFINGLRGKVESKYDFFEWYLTFSSLSSKKEEPEYVRRDVEDCYKLYFTQETQTEEETLNERKQKTFAGMLNFLKSDINVLKQNLSAIEKPQSEDETQTILYILANLILSQAGEPAGATEELQDMLQKLWSTEAEGRSPEFYLLVLLLFWPDEAKPNPPNLGDCVQYMSQSYERTYQKHLHRRFLVPLFFYGKGEGLQRLVHALKPHQTGLERPVHSRLHQRDLELLAEGYESVEVECLQRIEGKVEDHRVFAVRNGQQIEVNAHKQAKVSKQGRVSFYLGFTIRGPVAFNITYHNCEYIPLLHSVASG
ncbi:sterile alpha motif domain-containing protein 9-like [Rhinichthys klamathensis goyatoka]|uniref:sterile alpha motif domain-containing protein 9-like n=1 Tax=Rhinichthys klamathensis goyatoka TaxID=3034132 RepID=UPI0024B5D60D|nr:sterile alpha motif domain-containing protein 9-like [Rhinichthys klamathensis goyatoka]